MSTRSPSTVERAPVWPTVTVPSVQRAEVQDGVAEPLRVLDLERRPVGVVIVPVSPTWPPCSA